jgi:predicted membrane protein
MRRIVILSIIVAIAAIAVAWSVSTIARPKQTGKVEATETSAPISPHDITVIHGKGFPIERWQDPF